MSRKQSYLLLQFRGIYAPNLKARNPPCNSHDSIFELIYRQLGAFIWLQPRQRFSKSWSHIFSDRGNLSRSTTLSWVDREGKSWKPLSKIENLLDKTLSIWKMQLVCLCIKLSCYPFSIYYRNGINFEFDKAKRKYTEEKTSTALFAKGLLECVWTKNNVARAVLRNQFKLWEWKKAGYEERWRWDASFTEMVFPF